MRCGPVEGIATLLHQMIAERDDNHHIENSGTSKNDRQNISILRFKSFHGRCNKCGNADDQAANKESSCDGPTQDWNYQLVREFVDTKNEDRLAKPRSKQGKCKHFFVSHTWTTGSINAPNTIAAFMLLGILTSFPGSPQKDIVAL